MTEYKYLIVGGGMTAGAAIDGIRSVDKEGGIALITAEADGPYDRPPLTKGLWKGDKGVADIRHEIPAGVELFTERQVKSLDLAKKQVIDAEERIYRYDKLLLATGGIPNQLSFGAQKIWSAKSADFPGLMFQEQLSPGEQNVTSQTRSDKALFSGRAAQLFRSGQRRRRGACKGLSGQAIRLDYSLYDSRYGQLAARQ